MNKLLLPIILIFLSIPCLSKKCLAQKYRDTRLDTLKGYTDSLICGCTGGYHFDYNDIGAENFNMRSNSLTIERMNHIEGWENRYNITTVNCTDSVVIYVYNKENILVDSFYRYISKKTPGVRINFRGSDSMPWIPLSRIWVNGSSDLYTENSVHCNYDISGFKVNLLINDTLVYQLESNNNTFYDSCGSANPAAWGINKTLIEKLKVNDHAMLHFEYIVLTNPYRTDTLKNYNRTVVNDKK